MLMGLYTVRKVDMTALFTLGAAPAFDVFVAGGGTDAAVVIVMVVVGVDTFIKLNDSSPDAMGLAELRLPPMLKTLGPRRLRPTVTGVRLRELGGCRVILGGS